MTLCLHDTSFYWSDLKFITQSVKMSEIYHSQCYEIFCDHVKIVVSSYLNDEIKIKYN